jgi:hypothetical protein
MTVTNKQLVDNIQTIAAGTPQSVYTSPSSGSARGTLITNFTASNSTAIDRSYQVYISTSGSASIPLIPTRTIRANETDTPPEIAGQFMPAGAELYVETSAASSISFTVSGREIS